MFKGENLLRFRLKSKRELVWVFIAQMASAHKVRKSRRIIRAGYRMLLLMSIHSGGLTCCRGTIFSNSRICHTGEQFQVGPFVFAVFSAKRDELSPAGRNQPVRHARMFQSSDDLAASNCRLNVEWLITNDSLM